MIDREELFERLEMDGPEDFGYFEQFAELVEMDEEIDFGDFYTVLSAVERDNITEINENYFTELEKHFPDDCDDFMEIIQQYWDCLRNLVTEAEDDSYRREYADQLYKFHQMYTKPDGASIDGEPCSVLDVITDNRASKFDNENHVYDFTNSMDCGPDYVSMRVGGYDEYESDDSMQDD